jgi:hypothetical protein
MVPLQMPPMQVMPVGHSSPQRPQLAPSFKILVQVSPPGPKQPFGVAPPHDSDAPPPQVPFWQMAPAGQAMPQFPQLPGSRKKSVQIVPVGDGHILGISGGQVVPPPVPHMPAWHAMPGAQAWPQPPQLAGSLLRFVQYCVPADPQALGWAAGHVGAPPQAPCWHATPAGQLRPQPPQFAASVIGFAQYAPPVGRGQAIGVGGEQVVWVPVHMPIWQPTPGGQTMPQAPQFAGSLIGFAQNGFVGFAGSAHAIPGGGQVGPPPVAQIPPMQG